MPKKIDADAKVATIRKSIEESPHHLRRVLCHTLLSEMGIKHRGPNNVAALRILLDKYGVCATPDPGDATLDEWIHLRLAEDVPTPPPPAVENRPDSTWFLRLANAPLRTEREVESRFASRLFHALGYSDQHEAMGLGIDIFQGVTVKHTEADLVYFADDDHDVKTGNVLVLVECKGPDHTLEEAVGQAHSYAMWVKPMYYVVTNGTRLQAYVYREGPIPNTKVVDTTRENLEADFDEVYRFLSLGSAQQTKAGLLQQA